MNLQSTREPRLHKGELTRMANDKDHMLVKYVGGSGIWRSTQSSPEGTIVVCVSPSDSSSWVRSPGPD